MHTAQTVTAGASEASSPQVCFFFFFLFSVSLFYALFFKKLGSGKFKRGVWVSVVFDDDYVWFVESGFGFCLNRVTANPLDGCFCFLIM